MGVRNDAGGGAVEYSRSRELDVVSVLVENTAECLTCALTRVSGPAPAPCS